MLRTIYENLNNPIYTNNYKNRMIFNYSLVKNKLHTMKQDKITKEKLEHYRKITEKAFAIAKKSIVKAKEKEAKEIVIMVEAYLSDSKHFEKQGYLVNAFGAIYYAHGWLDCGARLKIFDVSDDKLFTI